jgi:hypothetical protein
MNTLVTTSTIDQSERAQRRDCELEASKHSTQPFNYGSELGRLRPTRAEGEGATSDATHYCDRDECTYEIEEAQEAKESKEAKEAKEAKEVEEIKEAQELEETEEGNDLQERQEVNLSPKLSSRIDEAIRKCRVSNSDTNRPLFLLAHNVRSIEEELNARFSMDATVEVVKRWKTSNHGYLKEDHDYLTEFLDKLSLVRFPRGRALVSALEIARNTAPAQKTTRLSPDVQLLGSLCKVLQDQAGTKPFFLAGRSAAKVLGKPHETVASWLRALCRLGVIKRISKGSRGMASRYVYPAGQA